MRSRAKLAGTMPAVIVDPSQTKPVEDPDKPLLLEALQIFSPSYPFMKMGGGMPAELPLMLAEGGEVDAADREFRSSGNTGETVHQSD